MITVCGSILNTVHGPKENIRVYEKGTDYEINEGRCLNVKDDSGKLLGTYSTFLWVEKEQEK